MKEPITIYRIENEVTQHGMWYLSDGTYDPFIIRLRDGKSKHLDMSYDEHYRKDGHAWICAGRSREQMKYWFSAQDALELYEVGYRLYEFTVTNYIIEEFQVLFTRESIIRKVEIPLEEIWDINSIRGDADIRSKDLCTD